MGPSVAATHFRNNKCCPYTVTVATSNHLYGCKPREEKESLSLLLFCAVTVTLQGSFKCNFANLKCSILYCIINLVFHIPLIGFLKSIQIYQVALNSFYKETLNDTGSRKFFPSLRNSV